MLHLECGLDAVEYSAAERNDFASQTAAQDFFFEMDDKPYTSRYDYYGGNQKSQ
jgi:hypothetical protein